MDQFQSTQSIIPKSYNCKTMEGNWYEDRCTSNFNYNNKKDYMINNPNEWQFDTTSKEYGSWNKEYPSLKNKFSQSSDNYINFQSSRHLYTYTTYKQSYDAKFSETFNQNNKVNKFK